MNVYFCSLPRELVYFNKHNILRRRTPLIPALCASAFIMPPLCYSNVSPWSKVSKGQPVTTSKAFHKKLDLLYRGQKKVLFIQNISA